VESNRKIEVIERSRTQLHPWSHALAQTSPHGL